MTSSASPPPGPISVRSAAGWALAAVVCFHLANWRPAAGVGIVAYLFCLMQVARVAKTRFAFYLGLGAAMLMVAPHLWCFWTIFGVGAVALWLVLSFWTALFVALAQTALRRFGRHAIWAIPFLWTGLEYFRSELYYLRFSWLKAGDALGSGSGVWLLPYTGVFGLGFLLSAIAVCLWWLQSSRKSLLIGCIAVTVLSVAGEWFIPPSPSSNGKLRIAGVQLEFPTEPAVLKALDRVAQKHPDAELLMLSEYTFDGLVPDSITNWCHANKKFLLVGGKDAAPGGEYFNTAFVIGPQGEVVFRQAKCVPIQFFKDGLPAARQQLWPSPWGPIGICICYDLSYTRVTDALVRLGAKAILVPTMDVADWGAHQHKLHARVAPIRAGEYRVPIFRLASSGISQVVDQRGTVLATAPFPGEGEILYGTLNLSNPGTIPLDRYLAPLSVVISALILLAAVFNRPRIPLAPTQVEAAVR